MNRRNYWLLGPAVAVVFAIASDIGAAQQNPRSLVVPNTEKVRDVFSPLVPQEVTIRGGFLGSRIDANAKNRMLSVDEDDMLDAFERREALHQDWQGEHVGKFLHAATLAWNYDQDPKLKVKIDRVVARLLKTQEPDGYFGTYAKSHRWTSWDVWVHKYDLLGLLTYYQFTRLANHDRPTPLGTDALNACRKIGNLLISTFGTEPGKLDINKSGEHMGMAPDSVLEPIVLLYRATNDRRYLDFARYIVSNYDAPGGPAILATLETKGSVRAVANAKAYEMTSNFNGLLELYRATGEERLLKLMQTAWNDIAKNRLYLTGSASAGEVFQDDFNLPNGMSASICETCVTVTWEQMNLQMLRLTGDPRCADELEKSVYNHLLAAQKPTGDDWAYYTPLDGHKPYDSATTCCHSSGPRGVALIPCIAYMASSDGGLVVNFYNDGTATTRLKSGGVTIDQATRYPVTGDVTLTVTPERNRQKFPLRLRIPPLASQVAVAVNGQSVESSGTGYVVIDREWSRGDVVTLSMMLGTRIVTGDHDNLGKAAIMHGPLVLALDSGENVISGPLNRIGLGMDPSTTADVVLVPAVGHPNGIAFTIQGEIAGKGKAELTLVPFADAGGDGKSRFEVWIPLKASNGDEDSLLSGCKWEASRQGNVMDDIADDDTSTFAVTFNANKADEDWFSVTALKPVTVGRVVYAHGKSFHDGGWFDTENGVHYPMIQAQTEVGGVWKTIATLENYPKTSSSDSAGLKDGQKFVATFPPIAVIAIRVIGKPACGDNPIQNFASCSELQAFAK